MFEDNNLLALRHNIHSHFQCDCMIDILQEQQIAEIFNTIPLSIRDMLAAFSRHLSCSVPYNIIIFYYSDVHTRHSGDTTA